MPTSKTTRTPTDRQEHHEFHFQGVWLPKEVLALMQDHTINGNDVIVLCLISAFSHGPHNSCWASNGYIAKACNVTDIHVSRTISKLAKVGLITTWQEKGRRHLVTNWINPVLALNKNVKPAKQKCLAEDTSLHSVSEKKLASLRKRPTPSGRAASNASVANDTFIPEDTQPSSKITEWARRLHTVVTDKLKLRRAWHRSNWEEAFRLLQKDVDGDVARIEEVLAWYEENPKLFRIVHAKYFRQQFHILEERMERDHKRKPPQVIITPDADEVVARLNPTNWPRGSGDQLASAVQRSLDAYRPFRKKINQVKDKKLTSFIRNIEWDLNRDAKRYVEKWFLRVLKQVKGWKEWNGDLSRYVFSPDHDMLKAEGEDLARKFGDKKAWKRLMEAIA
jgi:hypothetical protein